MPNPSFNIWQVFLSQAASWFQSQLRHYIQLNLKRNIKVSYNVLLLFNRFWEILMVKECWTWNINWHLLLWQCVHDFGPVYSFRCFSLERLNGIIGKCVTNDKHVCHTTYEVICPWIILASQKNLKVENLSLLW